MGPASQVFVRDGNGYRAVGGPTYTFKAVTPESISLLRFGSGIAALARRVRRKI